MFGMAIYLYISSFNIGQHCAIQIIEISVNARPFKLKVFNIGQPSAILNIPILVTLHCKRRVFSLGQQSPTLTILISVIDDETTKWRFCNVGQRSPILIIAMSVMIRHLNSRFCSIGQHSRILITAELTKYPNRGWVIIIRIKHSEIEWIVIITFRIEICSEFCLYSTERSEIGFNFTFHCHYPLTILILEVKL